MTIPSLLTLRVTDMNEKLCKRLLEEIEKFDIAIGCPDEVDYWDVSEFLDKLREILNYN